MRSTSDAPCSAPAWRHFAVTSGLFFVLVGSTMAMAQTPRPSAPQADATQTALVGRIWTLVEVGGQRLPPGTGNVPTLQFGAEGQLAGFDGCNRFAGRYVWDTATGRLQVGTPMPGTQMGCPMEVMQRATRFMALLSDTPAARVESGTLLWLDARGRVTARFAAAAPPGAPR